jgi:hypothetical protein
MREKAFPWDDAGLTHWTGLDWTGLDLSFQVELLFDARKQKVSK